MPPMDAQLQVTISLYLAALIVILLLVLLIVGIPYLRKYLKAFNEQENNQKIIASQKDAIDQLTAQTEEKKKEIDSFQSVIQDLQAEIDVANTKVLNLQKKKRDLERCQENNKVLMNDQKHLQNKYDELKSELQLLKEERIAKSDEQVSPDKENYRNFIYHISHEISNPLQSIQTSLDNMAGLEPGDEGQWEQHRSIITDEIRRLRELTTSLRTLSRLEAGAPIDREPVNIKGVIESVILELEEQAGAKGVTLKTQCPSHPARVIVNRDHIRQVLINLVDNSIKYSQKTGGEVVIAVQDGAERLCIRVLDNGIGIPEEDLPYVFDVAYRSPGANFIDKNGSGLGLAIAKRIINQHGGEVRVESKLGQGTTVTFDLPVAEKAEGQKPQLKKNQPADGVEGTGEVA